MSATSDKTPKVEYSEEAGGLVSAVPLCADIDGNLVPCDDTRANTQVAAPGVVIPPKLAKKYGLVQAKEAKKDAVSEAGEADEAEAEVEKPARSRRGQ